MSKPKHEQEKPKRLTPGFVETTVQGPFMLEMIADTNGRLRFATNDSEAVANDWEFEEEIFIPPCTLKSFVENRSLRLPSGADRGVTTPKLISEIKVFIQRWADIPEGWLEAIAHYVVMTWVYDCFTAVPYLRFLGEYGTGKTRMLQVAGALCYRSLALSGNITGAALFRSIDLIRGTLVVDEADLKNSAEWSDIIKVFNNGYTPGFPVVRCDVGSRTFVPQSFCVYGPKIISTRHRFDDPATESRCLTFETQERKVDPHIPLQLSGEFESDAQALRNKLLGWRFDNFEHIEPDDSMLRHLDPRMAQVGASLLAVAGDKEAMARFLERYAQSAKEDSPREIVKQYLGECRKDVVSISDVTQIVNQQLEGSGQGDLTHKAVGSIVRSLGYRTKRKNTGYVVERVNL